MATMASKKSKSNVISFSKYSNKLIVNRIFEDFGGQISKNTINDIIKNCENGTEELGYIQKYHVIKLCIIAEQMRLEMMGGDYTK
jgi:hypothetical protein